MNQVLTCPKCQGTMRTHNRQGVQIEQCDMCRGIFLDYGELESLSRMGAPQHAQPQPMPGPAPQPMHPNMAQHPGWGGHAPHPGWGHHGGYHAAGGFARMLFFSS